MILVLMSKMLSETDFVGLGRKSLHGAMQRGPLVLITNCDKIYLVTMANGRNGSAGQQLLFNYTGLEGER